MKPGKARRSKVKLVKVKIPCVRCGSFDPKQPQFYKCNIGACPALKKGKK